MKNSHFPKLIEALPPFQGPFDAYRLGADRCDVLFASYPAGTEIAAHTHPTENCGVITAGELVLMVDGEESRYGPAIGTISSRKRFTRRVSRWTLRRSSSGLPRTRADKRPQAYRRVGGRGY